MAIGPGTRLGPYEITAQIGVGGMGEVYRATDTNLKRAVAIKVLPEAVAADAERLARFDREARTLAALNHPNIAAIYGLEKSPSTGSGHAGTTALVMELVEGPTLADTIAQGAIPVSEALPIARQIAEALEAAHEHGIIHRDLKPANVKVRPDGTVKVLDFGLAKELEPAGALSGTLAPTITTPAMTQAGMILGTAAYMSPEQAKGRAVDARADVWAFGAVLYEMLTGRRAFEGDDVSEVFAGVIKLDPDWTRLPPLPPLVASFLKQCLRKDPRQRLAHVQDMRLALEGAFETESAPPSAAPADTAPPWHRLRPVVAAAVIAGLAVGSAVWFMTPAPAPGPVVRFSLPLPTGQTLTTNFVVPVVAVSPDGTRIAYAADGQLYVRNVGESVARPVPGTDEGGVGAGSPTFSPDGQSLTYVHLANFAGPFVLKRVPVTGGTPLRIHEVAEGSSYYLGLTWPTPDSLVFANAEGILRIGANGGEPELLVAATGDEQLDSPQLLPGGNAVLFARVDGNAPRQTRWDTAQIVVQTVGGDDRTVVWEGGSTPRYLPSGHLVYAQGSSLFAVPFDLDTPAVVGSPVPVLEGLQRSGNGGQDIANVAVSETGTLVNVPAAVGEDSGLLALAERDGMETPLAVPPARYQSPRISPDGRQLAVEVLTASGQSDIWVYDLSGASAIRRLTQDGTSTRPIWTPDSQRLTYGSDRGGGWGIYEQAADGSAVAVRLTTAEAGHQQYPDAWSLDGRTLAFIEVGTFWSLWTLPRDGGDASLFAEGGANIFGATFSPDGRWLAYTDTSAPVGIRVQPFPPTQVVHQITDGGQAWPVWSTDGRELFFRTGVGTTTGATRLQALDVTTAGGFTFRDLATLPIDLTSTLRAYRDYDLHPDGQRFVVVVPESRDSRDQNAGPPQRRIDVVLNWQQELESRVPVP
jgi:serine/threonine-protein kinase